MKKILVAPSILSGDFGNMGKTVEDCTAWGADIIHCDVMDGVYVPNFTFGMPMIKAIREHTNLPLDVHLMMTEPEKYVERFADAGADIITFHPEASKDPFKALNLIKAKGKRCGLAFNPNVKIEDYEYLFIDCDMIVVMTVYAGYGGQKLIPECLDRAKYIVSRLQSLGIDALVEIDGGVTEENSKEVALTGADVLVAGSAVFKSSDKPKTIQLIQNALLN
ncbi:MAG: ribulose-phosphate 3-epimerase [Clostridia bacterium]|nr:ribulose-phosphate 3-epimerase [Clostridia bacterium]